jgi:uncharacterized protein YggE
MQRFAPVLVCATFGVALAIPALPQTIQIDKTNKTIAISTTDEATATADIAAVTVGFEAFGPDYDSAYADGGKISHAVIDALHKAGVDDKSIESGAQNLQRNARIDDRDTPEQSAQKRFVMSQSWVVSVPSQAAAEVIRIAVAAGANQSGAIDWRLSDRKALQAKAAANALVKARAVASQMADGLHVKLGDLIYASNEAPPTQLYLAPQEFRSGMGGNSGGGAYELRGLLPLEIRPQTIREEATVYAVFAIE